MKINDRRITGDRNENVKYFTTVKKHTKKIILKNKIQKSFLPLT